MKIETTCKTLKVALSRVSAAVSSKATMVVLSHIKMLAMDGKLTITATNLDIVIIEKIEVTVEKEGEIAISYDKIRSIFDSSDDVAKIELLAGTGAAINAQITVGKFHRKVPCLKVSDLPKYMAPKSDTVESVVSGELIKAASESVAHFTYGVEGVLEGVNYSKPTAGTLVVQATNKNVIARQSISAEINFDSFTIPLVAATAIARIAPGDEDITIQVDESCASFKWFSGELRSKVYQAKYPNINGPIKASDNGAPWIKGDVKSILPSVIRVSDAHGYGYVSVAAKQDKLKISTQSGSDEAEDLVEIKGEAMEHVRVNGGYLQEVLKACPTAQIELARTINSLSLRSSDGGFYCLIAELREQ